MESTRLLIDWIAQIVAVSAVLVAPVTAVVATIKTVASEHIPTNYYPATAVAVGVVLGAMVSLAVPFSMSVWTNVFAGAVAGYSASALYAAAAERDAARVAASKPSPAIIGIPTVPTSPTPHPIDTYLRPMVFSSPGTTTEQVTPRG